MQKCFICIDTLLSQNTYIISRPGDIENFYSQCNIIVDIVVERLISTTISCSGMIIKRGYAQSSNTDIPVRFTLKTSLVLAQVLTVKSYSRPILPSTESVIWDSVVREGLHWTTTDDLTVTRPRQTWSGSHGVWHISTAIDNSLTPLQTLLTHVSKSTDCG